MGEKAEKTIEERLATIENKIKDNRIKNYLILGLHIFILITFMWYCNSEHSKILDIVWELNQVA